MVQVQKLTTEVLLSAPRRTGAVPNRLGSLALHTVSTHTWGDKTVTELKVMDLDSTESWTLSSDEKVHDPAWIPGTDDEIVYLKSGEKGKTEIYVTKGSIKKDGEHTKIAEIDAPLRALKLKELEGGNVAFVVTGLVGHHGGLYNEEADEKKTTARVYDTVNIRVWDTHFKLNRYSLWYTTLVNEDGKWKLSSELHNLINSDEIEPFGNYDVMDPKDFFDISHKGIAFMARSFKAERNWEFAVANFPYFVPVDSWTIPPSQKPKPIGTKAKSHEVWVGGGVKFSPDAENIAFMYGLLNDPYNKRLHMTSVASLDAFDVLALVNAVELETCDHDPIDGFDFAGSSSEMILVSQHLGRSAISTLKLADGEKPRMIYNEGTLAGLFPLKEGKFGELLVSTSSFIDSSLWQVLDVKEGEISRVVSSATKHGAKYGLHKKQVQEIWFSGADDICVQSWMILPSDFDENKKYPWVFLPHGGPVSVWADSWSTRWNMVAWAEAGYIMIAPNVTGSTGFGLDFCRRINGEWGGNPYQDCVKLIEHLETLPYLDQSKAVYAGASYSGYLGSWFFSNDIIKKFCAAVWHDGIFCVQTSMIQGDYCVDGGDFKGFPDMWSNFDEMEKWNPATPERLRNWRHCPPTIVIHSEKDFRCPIVEGIAAFKTLQGLKVPSRFLTFTDENHWVLKPENSLVWHKQVLGWVKRCVDGELKRGDTTW